MKRWRRPLLLIALLSAGGAVVTGLVAFASQWTTPQTRGTLPTQWPFAVQEGWPERPEIAGESRGRFAQMAIFASTHPSGAIGVVVARYGWPRRALRSTEVSRMNDVTGVVTRQSTAIEIGGRRLAIEVEPAGFLLNTVFYTAILALPLSFFPIRRRLRARRGRCPKCGYDLAGLPGAEKGAEGAAPCPECGVITSNRSSSDETIRRKP